MALITDVHLLYAGLESRQIDFIQSPFRNVLIDVKPPVS